MSGLGLIFRPWFIKLCLLVLFPLYMGWYQAAWQMIESEGKHENSIEQLQLAQQQRIYCRSLVDLAKNKVATGGVYSSLDYFADLKAAHAEKTRIGLKLPGSDSTFLLLHDLSKSRLMSLKGEELRIEMSKTEEARKDYEGLIDPAEPARQEVFVKIRALGWTGTLVWLLFLYLKIMPFAGALFLVWLFENQEQKREFLFPDPIRFMLSLIIYPITIGRVFGKWLVCKEREYRAEAELRRTKENLFVYLSADEVQRIKEFGKSSLSIFSWQKCLVNSGLEPRHSLSAALAVTMLLSLVPVLAQAEEIQEKEGGCLSEIIWAQSMEPGQHLARMSLEDDGQSQLNGNGQQDKLLVLGELFDIRPVFAGFYKVQEIGLYIKKFCRQIEHVPIFGYSVKGCQVAINLN